MEKRGDLAVDRLFVTYNPNWNERFSKGWYKNSPIGKNTISSWLKQSANKTGIDVIKVKVTNHSARATAVSSLAKSGVEEQQIIKITGHSNSQSIKTYLQMDADHHQEHSLKIGQSHSQNTDEFTTMGQQSQESRINPNNIVYNSCVFNITNNYSKN